VEERTVALAKANEEVKTAFEALAEKDARLHEDLLQAQAFQQRILPKMPLGETVRFSALYKPADMVGGDIYDVCELAPSPGEGDSAKSARRFRVFVADTTGHGVQASLRTMVLKTEYDRVKLAHDRPSEVLAELNRKIARVYPGLEMRCSACCFDVETSDGGDAVVHYANAAHPPLLRVSAGKVDEIYAGGTFIGIIDDVEFRETMIVLHEGDLLLAYTDGLCEQEDGSGKAFGLERMEELLSRPKLHAAEAVKTLDDEVGTFAGGRALDDDILLVCIECVGPSGRTGEVPS
jgi:sigma-B regulation protein RsbU (phosphoserine phosphatase)